jgi:SAM-dependent methyltransferase
MAPPPRIFYRTRIRRHLDRRAGGADNFVARLVRDELGDRLLHVVRRFEHAAAIGPAADMLPETGATAEGTFPFEKIATAAEAPGVRLVDPETLVLPRSDYDLVVSVLDLQVVDDVPGYLARIRAHLKPDGLFVAATIGGDSLVELRQAFLVADADLSGGAAARVAPMMPVAEAGALLQRAGFALPVADVETHQVRYASPLALMRELKALGAANPLREPPLRLATPALLAKADAAYREIAGDADGRVRATLEIIWMSGWVSHESQQKPARRGSATVSLKDVLERKP